MGGSMWYGTQVEMDFKRKDAINPTYYVYVWIWREHRQQLAAGGKYCYAMPYIVVYDMI